MTYPPNDPIWAQIAAQTHVFQNVRPRHPEGNAVCSRCGLVLPHGPILAFGPGGLPPCGDQPLPQDNRA